MGRKMGSMFLAAALAAPVWAWPGRALEPQPPATAVEHGGDAAQSRAKALAEMERLRDEIQTLAAVRGAQAALLAWNRERARTGAPPAALSTAPCRDAALEPWCRLLPATFGNDVSGKNSGGDGR